MQTTSHLQRSAGERNALLVRHFIDSVWNAADPDAISRFVDDRFVDGAYQPPNQQGHREMVKMFNTAFTKATHTIEELTADAERAVARIRIQATHVAPFRGIAATGAVISVRQYRSFRIRDDRIVEHHALLDMAALLAQIGGRLDAANACKLK